MLGRLSIAAVAVFSLVMTGGGTSVFAKEYVTFEGGYAPVSGGCFRMRNEHVVDLYQRVHIGAPVYVVNRIEAVIGQQ